MSAKKVGVFGIYSTRAAVENVTDSLVKAGFPVSGISVLLPESVGSKDMGTEKSTKAPEGAAAGASTGGVIGGTLGLLAGIGLLTIPGLGPFIAAGPIMAALAGAGVGAAVGGISGALVGLGIPEYEAKQYEGKIKGGNILISVHTEDGDERDEAEQIFKNAGAHDISYTGESSVPKKERRAV